MYTNYPLRRRDKRLQDVLSFKDLRKVDQKSSPFSKGDEKATRDNNIFE